MLLRNNIRSLRDEQGILQRQLAAYLEIDTLMFSKIEPCGWEREMFILWLADEILDALDGENELRLEVIETVKCKFQDM